MLETLWFDQLFLGVSAIANDGALYSVDSAEASLNRCMLARSAASYLLAKLQQVRRHGSLSRCGLAHRPCDHRWRI